MFWALGVDIEMHVASNVEPPFWNLWLLDGRDCALSGLIHIDQHFQ